PVLRAERRLKRRRSSAATAVLRWGHRPPPRELPRPTPRSTSQSASLLSGRRWSRGEPGKESASTSPSNRVSIELHTPSFRGVRGYSIAAGQFDCLGCRRFDHRGEYRHTLKQSLDVAKNYPGLITVAGYHHPEASQVDGNQGRDARLAASSADDDPG